MKRLLACLLAAAPLCAQTPAYRARLLGVYDLNTGEPIEGVEVSDALSGVKALTTRTGTVSLVFLPDGGSLVRIRKVGYEPLTQMIAISPVDTVPLTLMLTPLAQRLPAVVTKDSAPKFISPGLRDFEERRAKGFGYFITEAEMRKNDNRRISDIVRQLPGMKVECRKRAPFECYAVSTRLGSKLAILGGACTVTIYDNGIEVAAGVLPPDLNALNVNEYSAIEFYPSGATIPMQYNKTGSSCGVMLLWGRER